MLENNHRPTQRQMARLFWLSSREDFVGNTCSSISIYLLVWPTSATVAASEYRFKCYLRTGPYQEPYMGKFRKGSSGNPGGRPKVLGEVQELARQRAPEVIAELARLALKAKSETVRISAARELLDRGFGKSRQSMEISAPTGDPIRELLDDIDERAREQERSRRSITQSNGPDSPNCA
jgi:hypothetical protein